MTLRARLADAVDGNRPARRRTQLRAVLDAPEVVGNVPVIRAGSARDILAAPNVPVVCRLAATAHVRAYRGSGNSSASGGDVPAASAADLVPENPADDPADDCPRNIGATAIFDDLLALDPAALLRRSDHRAHRSHRRLIEPFAGASTIIVGRRGERCGRFVLVARIAADRSHRGNAVIHAHS